MRNMSILTVTVRESKGYEEVFLHSVAARLKNVKEVIVVCNNTSRQIETKVVDGIVVKKIGFEGLTTNNPMVPYNPASDHATALHYGLPHVTGEYLMFSDPDVFFYAAVDEFYISLMERYKIMLCGISIANPPIQAPTYFPSVINCMIRVRDLPDANFLKHYKRMPSQWVHTDPEMTKLVPINGQWLLPGAIPEFYQDYPNPEGTFDTMCNLWLWVREQKGSWLAFQAMDQHTYFTSLYKSNFKLRDRFPSQKILYHVNGGTAHIRSNPEFVHDYKKFYLESLNK